LSKFSLRWALNDCQKEPFEGFSLEEGY